MVKIVPADLLAMHHTWLAELLGQLNELGNAHLIRSANNEIKPCDALQGFYAYLRIAARYHHIGMRRAPQHSAGSPGGTWLQPLW